MKLNNDLSRRSFKSPLLGFLVLFLCLSAQSQDTTYTWVSTDGNPYDFSASLILDSPSGYAPDIRFSETDIIEFQFTCQDPYFPYSPNFEPDFQYGGFGGTAVGSIGPWSPTTIPSMFIEFFPANFVIGANYIDNDIPGAFGNGHVSPDLDDYGFWAGPGTVPDGAWTFFMLIPAIVAMLIGRFCPLFRRFPRP